MFDLILRTVEAENNGITLIELIELKSMLSGVGVEVSYDQNQVNTSIVSYIQSSESDKEAERVPFKYVRGEEILYSEAIMIKDSKHRHSYGAAMYLDTYHVTKEMIDVIFNLYIVEEELTDSVLDFYNNNPKISKVIGHLPYNIIRMVGKEKAEEMNKVLGMKIY